MLSTKAGQVGFFDAAELVGPLPEGSFFALLAEHGQRVVRDEDFPDCYSERLGRPSIPPSQLAKVLLLQYRTGLSDEQAMEGGGQRSTLEDRARAAGRSRGLELEDADVLPRSPLVARGKERLVLEATLSLAGRRAAPALPGRADRRLDAGCSAPPPLRTPCRWCARACEG